MSENFWSFQSETVGPIVTQSGGGRRMDRVRSRLSGSIAFRHDSILPSFDNTVTVGVLVSPSYVHFRGRLACVVMARARALRRKLENVPRDGVARHYPPATSRVRIGGDRWTSVWAPARRLLVRVGTGSTRKPRAGRKRFGTISIPDRVHRSFRR